MSATEWSELGVSELPTGTVTLLLADVEGSTRLWETQPAAMNSAIARLDETLAGLVAVHNGVRPVEQGEGDSFVLAFARASDAVVCALALQRAPLAPIRLRVGLNTGEIQLRDEGNYIGPTINRTARLRDLGHGGQTLLSGATESMIVDHLPDDAWLTDLGVHTLRDLPRPERIVQLCHPDIRNDFPPLRIAKAAAAQRFPTQLTSFVGRTAQLAEVQNMLTEQRLVTLTGAGGAGKTRMAIHVGSDISNEFSDGAWYVDLAPITDTGAVPVTVARALGLPDQPGRSTTESILRFIDDREMLVVLDNCEHLLDASAKLVVTLLDSCPRLTLFATSREPIGVAGECTWRVPSLSLEDESVELFTERARLTAPDFEVDASNVDSVVEICRRLDGMPLAIELAAARVRALSVAEILGSLHDRFRLLTGGARTAVQRQQTLRASVDWSHALLTEPERTLFRRLAAFLGGFDMEAAQSVAGGGEIERYQVLDQLALLVDKSLVVTESAKGRTRYRLLETVRQYAMEKLGESGESDAVRSRHRDHYAALAKALDRSRLLDWAETEIDNLRAAFGWSMDRSDIESAIWLASSLSPLWLERGRVREGVAWIDAIIAQKDRHQDISASAYARVLGDKAMFDAVFLGIDSTELADRALTIARDVGNPVELARALAVRGRVAGRDGLAAKPFVAEAITLARAANHKWLLSQLLAGQALGAFMSAGDPLLTRAAAEEGIELAEAIGDGFHARQCRWCLAWAHYLEGDVGGAAYQFDELASQALSEHDVIIWAISLAGKSYALSYQGDADGARTAANAVVEMAGEVADLYDGLGHTGLAFVALVDGDVVRAHRESLLAWDRSGVQRETVAVTLVALTSLLVGDIVAARRWADEAVPIMRGWHLIMALNVRARVAVAEGRPELAERDIHDALSCAAAIRIVHCVADLLECLAGLAGEADGHEAARLFGAADALRHRTTEVRFPGFQSGYEASVASVIAALGEDEYAGAWAEGASLSTEQAIAYAQRGRGERKRPSSGWASLTPTELDVVRLVSEGLANKDIATRLFVSPRTVQTHLTHVYTKLALTSRVQLAQEAARHS